MFNDIDVMSHRDITNVLADNVVHTAFSTDAFISLRNKVEKQYLNSSSENGEVYNRSFCMEELPHALHIGHNTSAGPDEIH